MKLHWLGELAVPVLGKQPGEKLEALFAVLLQFKDGQVFRQENFDCFLP